MPYGAGSFRDRRSFGSVEVYTDTLGTVTGGNKVKKVLILSGSPRKGGNSDILCDQFMKGALEQGNEVEKIFIAEKKIAPCSGCYFCKKSGGRCALNNDMGEILQKIIDF